MCNCGVLAQTLLGPQDYWVLQSKELELCLQSGHWHHRARIDACQTTGLPRSAVFKALYDAGLEEKDFRDIEFLDGYGVSSFDMQFQDRYAVARYFDQKADELEYRRKHEDLQTVS